MLEIAIGIIAAGTLINTLLIWGTARNVSRLIDHEVALMEQESRMWHATRSYRDVYLANEAPPSDGINITHLK